MNHRVPRRLLAGLGIALTAAAVAVPGAPASAAAIDTFTVHTSGDIAMPAGMGTGSNVWVEAPGTELLAETVTFDFSGVSSFASLRADVYEWSNYDCATAGTVVTCTTEWPSVRGEDSEWFDLVDFEVTVAENAPVGATGKIKINVQAGGTTASATNEVTVTEPVDLETADLDERTVNPGDTAGAPLVVKNVGTTAINGVHLSWNTVSGLQETQRYGNCRYVAAPVTWDPEVATRATCSFDVTIEPGQVFQLPDTFAFTVAKDYWAPSKAEIYFNWMPTRDFEDMFDGEADQPWETGTGPALTLSPVSGTSAQRSLQQDLNWSNNGSHLRLKVAGDQKADVIAHGDTVTANKGDTATATARVENAGPARLNATIGGWMPSAIVTVPQGTTATGASDRCRPIISGDKRENWELGELGEAGGTSYLCGVRGPMLVGQTVEFPFELKVDGDFASSAGAVTLRLFNVQSEGEGKDLNAENNVAQLVVKSNGAGDLGGGGGGQGGGGEGGELPITGTQVGVFGAVGAALLVLGVGGFLLARRRRTTFVA